jgi:hypothetical protein
VKPTVVQNQNVQALGVHRREAVQKILKAIAVESISFDEKTLPSCWLDRPVKIEVLISGFLHLNRFDSRTRDSTPRDRHQPEPALILAKQPNGPPRLGSNRLDSGWKLLFEDYLLRFAFFG